MANDETQSSENLTALVEQMNALEDARLQLGVSSLRTNESLDAVSGMVESLEQALLTPSTRDDEVAREEIIQGLNETNSIMSELNASLAYLSNLRNSAGDLIPELSDAIGALEGQRGALQALMRDIASGRADINTVRQTIVALQASVATAVDKAVDGAHNAISEFKNEVYLTDLQKNVKLPGNMSANEYFGRDLSTEEEIAFLERVRDNMIANRQGAERVEAVRARLAQEYTPEQLELLEGTSFDKDAETTRQVAEDEELNTTIATINAASVANGAELPPEISEDEEVAQGQRIIRLRELIESGQLDEYPELREQAARLLEVGVTRVALDAVEGAVSGESSAEEAAGILASEHAGLVEARTARTSAAMLGLPASAQDALDAAYPGMTSDEIAALWEAEGRAADPSALFNSWRGLNDRLRRGETLTPEELVRHAAYTTQIAVNEDANEVQAEYETIQSYSRMHQIESELEMVRAGYFAAVTQEEVESLNTRVAALEAEQASYAPLLAREHLTRINADIVSAQRALAFMQQTEESPEQIAALQEQITSLQEQQAMYSGDPAVVARALAERERAIADGISEEYADQYVAFKNSREYAAQLTNIAVLERSLSETRARLDNEDRLTAGMEEKLLSTIEATEAELAAANEQLALDTLRARMSQDEYNVAISLRDSMRDLGDSATQLLSSVPEALASAPLIGSWFSGSTQKPTTASSALLADAVSTDYYQSSDDYRELSVLYTAQNDYLNGVADGTVDMQTEAEYIESRTRDLSRQSRELAWERQAGSYAARAGLNHMVTNEDGIMTTPDSSERQRFYNEIYEAEMTRLRSDYEANLTRPTGLSTPDDVIVDGVRVNTTEAYSYVDQTPAIAQSTGVIMGASPSPTGPLSTLAALSGSGSPAPLMSTPVGGIPPLQASTIEDVNAQAARLEMQVLQSAAEVYHQNPALYDEAEAGTPAAKIREDAYEYYVQEEIERLSGGNRTGEVRFYDAAEAYADRRMQEIAAGAATPPLSVPELPVSEMSVPEVGGMSTPEVGAMSTPVAGGISQQPVVAPTQSAEEAEYQRLLAMGVDPGLARARAKAMAVVAEQSTPVTTSERPQAPDTETPVAGAAQSAAPQTPEQAAVAAAAPAAAAGATGGTDAAGEQVAAIPQTPVVPDQGRAATTAI